MCSAFPQLCPRYSRPLTQLPLWLLGYGKPLPLPFNNVHVLEFCLKTFRKGASRYLTISKTETCKALRKPAMLQLVKNSRQTIQSMLQRFPVTNKERLELLPKTDKNQVNEGKNSRFHLVRPVVTLNTIFILLPYFVGYNTEDIPFQSYPESSRSIL